MAKNINNTNAQKDEVKNSSEINRGAADKKSSKSKKIIIISAASVAVVALLICAALFIPFGESGPVFKQEKFLPGVSVNGVDLSEMTISEAKAALKDTQEKLANEYKELSLSYDTVKINILKEDLGITYNTDKVLSALMEKSIKGEAATGNIRAFLSFDGVRKKLQNLSKEIDKEPVAADKIEFDFETRQFKYTNGENGQKLNIEATMLDFVNQCMAKKTGNVPVKVDEVKKEGTNKELFDKMGVMATFSTWSTNNYNSTYNMGLAMQKMNGHTIMPGEIFSFHGAVGDSTKASNGWLPSGAWRGGKLVYDEYGGGICQAATTLYNCALKAGIEIVERHCHLQPSTYVSIGLDATVDYPWLDTRVRNDTEYPIYIVSEMLGTELRMTMYGYISDKWDEIKLGFSQNSYTPVPEPVYQTDESFADGQYELDRPGLPGATASASRSFYKNGELVKYESLTDSTYSAVAPLYKIGKNTDTSKIPEGSKSGTALLEKPEEPGTEEPGTGEPGTEEPGTGDPGTGDPGTGDPGTGDPGTGDPGTGDPGTGDPGTGDPGTGDPGTGDPGTGDPGTGDPGTGDPGTGDPGTGAPGTGDPGTGDPGTGDPGTGDPGTEDPGTGTPAP